MHHHDVTERSLFSLSWPIFIDLFLHFSTLLINTYMVSQVSKSYLAAMGVGNQVFDLCITIFSFISVGCSVVIAQYLGARQMDMAKKAIHISIAFNFLLGLFCATTIFFFGYKALNIMNMPEHLMEDGFDYLHILGICLIFEAVSLILAACLRVYGKSQVAMYVTLIVNLITIVGNILVLYVFDLGLVGVAWSTVFGRIICVILLACLLNYGLRIRLEIKEFFNWSKDLLGKILHIGLPAAGENMVWILQYMTALAFIGLMGETALAAQTLYFQLALFVMLFGISVSIGNEIFVGHLVGAKRFEDAYRQTFRSLKLGVGVTVIVVAVFWLMDMNIMHFLSKDAGIIDMLLPLFLLSVFLEPGRTLNIVMVNALRASGDAKFPLYTAMFFMWCVSIPIGYYLGIKMEMGIIGIWIGFACDEWLRGLTNTWRWKSKKWQAKRLDI
ncbi:MATE family efflux transporter [Pragia fontium]|uniref:Efflux protein, MATE family n=2 Tax=Pragia fontium TaxID=82985 RepID=A0AAJ5BFM4_9GAMM|nr:MATE family efflux transporter [Pragia fontium]AKJ41506.1 multidrug transporter MatE [Pragia fontium]SFB96416.1 putative efflux protein, MATE family [Pragia fontium DSM 5563 = ATCC 49100]SUB81768.1 Na(+)/drug antiporter [Pragia fontium]VEJ54311.1 Na(+)/drug antiporter [Pragia fontium]GKX63066.1 MATE family efflux transporter [Pragia fontium]